MTFVMPLEIVEMSTLLLLFVFLGCSSLGSSGRLGSSSRGGAGGRRGSFFTLSNFSFLGFLEHDLQDTGLGNAVGIGAFLPLVFFHHLSDAFDSGKDAANLHYTTLAF